MAGGLDSGVRIALLALAWLGGIALQLQQADLSSTGFYLGLAALGSALLLAVLAVPLVAHPATTGPPGRRAALLSALALVAGAALLGYGSTGWRAVRQLAQALPSELEGVDLQLTGVVAEMPQAGPTGSRFVFDVESARLGGPGDAAGRAVQLPQRLSLGWYRGFDTDAAFTGPGVDLRAGQRWSFAVRLKHPHGTLNPHGFDLELWLFEQGIGASGSVRVVSGRPATKLAENVGHPIERARQRLRDAIYAHVADPQAAGVLAALAVGDQAAIDREGWDLFRTTGVAHLMSISGLHVTMFAWLAGALIGRLWRRSGRLMLAVPAPVAARWGGLAAAAGYALIAGWGVPAQRTVWTIATVVLLRSRGARWPPLLLLAVAATVVTALDPWAMLQAGFWLSFVAVAMLMVSEPAVAGAGPAAPAPEAVSVATPLATGRFARLRAQYLPKVGAALRADLRTQAIASLGLTPLTLIFFQQMSIVGFVANLFAIPLVTLVITPLTLLGALLPALWTPAAWGVQALEWLLAILAGWPFAVWTAGAAPAWAVAGGLLGALLAILPLPLRLRALGLPLLLPLLFPQLPRPDEGRFELLAADIGQGTAVLVRTREHLLLYDTGPQYSPEADAGQRVLLPLLRARGETRVDLLVLSHRDSDHTGGAASLLGTAPGKSGYGLVREIRSSLEATHPLLQRGVPQRRCDAGESWVWDGVRFEFVHPLPGDHALALKPNAVSCVLRVQAAGGLSALLTGDIEAPQEAALVARLGPALHSSMLLVPHHGSRTSSSPAFIEAVSPQVAVVQAGYRSRYGHPAPDIVARYLDRGIPVVRSDACGAWRLAADGSTACERGIAARYWHHRLSAPFAGAAALVP